VATTGVYAPQKIYVLGNDQILTYEHTTDTWSIAQTEPSNRHSFRVAIIDDIVYVIGGLDFDHNVVSTNEQYVPIGYNATPLPTVSPSVPSESTVPSEPLLNYAHIAVIIVVVGIIAVGLFCFKKRPSKNSGKN
jgi:hypothetical protein